MSTNDTQRTKSDIAISLPQNPVGLGGRIMPAMQPSSVIYRDLLAVMKRGNDVLTDAEYVRVIDDVIRALQVKRAKLLEADTPPIRRRGGLAHA